MVEIIVLTIVIIVAFIAVGWFSHYRSQQHAKAFEKELQSGEPEQESDFHQRFDAVFEKQMHATEHEANTSIDAEPQVTLSGTATQPVTDSNEKPDPKIHISEPEAVTTEAEPEVDAASAPGQQQASVPDWDMVIALTIMAPDNLLFEGKQVMQVLDNLEMHFGDMHIYHRYSDASRKQVLFSAANILDPGTLIPQQLTGSTTPGLLLFTRLPGPVNGMTLFDELLSTAQTMSTSLGGVLCDDRRQPLSDDALEEMRSRIFNYNLALQQESSQRSDDYFT